jgi:hypothetical protein
MMGTPGLARRPERALVERIAALAAVLTLCMACGAWADSASLAASPQQQVGGTPPTTAPAKPTTQPGQGASSDSDAIRKLIEIKMKEAAARTTSRPAATPQTDPAAPQAGNQPKPPASPASRAPVARPLTPTSQPGATTKPSSAGCGGTPGQLDLTPPPPGQPQPHWACAQTEVTAEPVWAGQPAHCVVKVVNEGEAVLKIRLKHM